MTSNLAVRQSLATPLPPMIAGAGVGAARRFLEYFTANIRNVNTRTAYARAVGEFFRWCDARGITELRQWEPMLIAAYIESHPGSVPSQKQALSAINKLFDWLVVGQVLPFNPAASVRGPRYSLKRGKTPVLDAEQARQLLDAIDIGTVAGLRDRAFICVMVYSFALDRIGRFRRRRTRRVVLNPVDERVPGNGEVVEAVARHLVVQEGSIPLELLKQVPRCPQTESD